VITDDREYISAIRARLAERVGTERYELWFGPTTQLLLRSDALQVCVPSLFYQDWLRANFRKDLETSAAEVCGRAISIEFRVEPIVTANGLTDAASEATRNVLKSTSKLTPAAGITQSKMPADGDKGFFQQANPAQSAGAAAEGTIRRKLNSLETFVVGTSNCLAHKAAQMAVMQPGGYSPLLVHGPAGTGKTHLLEGIYSAFRRANPRAVAVYLSAEQFTSQFLHALHKSGMASFRAKYRELDLLVIDDLHFLAGKKATIGELQHTLDVLLRRGKQIVFAADRSPAALKVLGAELTSRLSGGMVCRLEPAEYATRLGIVRRQASQLGILVPEDVQAYLAATLTSQARELIGALKRLQAESLAHERPITLGLAEQSLVDLIDQQRVVKLPDIAKAVCEVFGLEADSLQSDRKSRVVSHPRMLAMYLARKYTRAPLSEIGSFFGKRSHSTVISAQKKIEEIMAAGSNQPRTAALNLEEAIRRVEAQLRAS
jgi:chromosomal replication initiator protein